MNISNSPAIQAATSAASGPSADGVNILVLKKALNAQASAAAALIQALPQPPALASSGNLGTRLNTTA